MRTQTPSEQLRDMKLEERAKKKANIHRLRLRVGSIQMLVRRVVCWAFGHDRRTIDDVCHRCYRWTRP